MTCCLIGHIPNIAKPERKATYEIQVGMFEKQ